MQAVCAGHLTTARENYHETEISCAVDAFLKLAATDEQAFTRNDLYAVTLEMVVTGQQLNY